MVITDYHVESVLRTYSRQLQRSKLGSRSESESQPLYTEKVTISDEARQRLLMERARSQALQQAYHQGEGDGPGGEGCEAPEASKNR